MIFFTIKERMKGMLRKFLLLTGASAVGFFLSVFLHNFLYAATILTSHLPLLPSLFEILHGLFFIIAVLVCPLGFLVGAGGSIALFIKERR